MTMLNMMAAAKESGVGRRTLYRWVKEGKIHRTPEGLIELESVARLRDLWAVCRRRGPIAGQSKAKEFVPPPPRRAISERERCRKALNQLHKVKDSEMLLDVTAFVILGIPRQTSELVEKMHAWANVRAMAAAERAILGAQAQAPSA